MSAVLANREINPWRQDWLAEANRIRTKACTLYGSLLAAERRERNCVALEAVELQPTPAITISVMRLPETRRQEMMVMAAVRRLDALQLDL
jgi:hypothetical protein